MALLDRCIFVAASAGTADFVVSAALTGYQTPAAANAVNGTAYHYAAQSSDLSQWEVGSGTYTVSGTKLSRDTVLFNSLGTTAKINFAAPPQVTITALAEDIPAPAITQLTGDLIAGPGSGSQAATLSKVKSIRQLLPSRKLVRSVMASPPTITFTTTNALSAGRLWPAASPTSDDMHSVVAGNAFSTARAAIPAVTGLAFAQDEFVLYHNVNYGGGTTQANQWQQSFIFGGSRLVTWVKGLTGYLMAKVNDEYVSLTAQTVPLDGNFYYWDFDFGSYGTRRIDIIGYYNVPFGGLYTSNLTDTLVPAPLRGPRVVVQSDSYLEGVGATYSAVSCWLSRFIDVLGWDNVISDGRGGSGLLAGSPTYRSRFATDVVPYAPDVVIVQGSINDAGSSPSALAAEAQALIALGQASFPNVLFVFTSEPLEKGATAAGNGPFARRDAVKAAVLGAGHLFVDLLTLPLPIGYVPSSNTLAAGASANATSLSVNSVPVLGGLFQFADGTPALVKSFSGTGPWTITTDAGGIQAGQSNNATMTQVGDCPWSGNGKVGSPTGWGNCDVVISSDGVHPTQSGHDMIGELVAEQLIAALKAA